MNIQSFKETVYEIAFGDGAINKNYSDSEVLEKIQEFSDKALKIEDITEEIQILTGDLRATASALDDLE